MVCFMCRGGKYTEEDAKTVMIQILNVVAFCHLQGVVHRDLKPEVIKRLFTSTYTSDVSSLILSKFTFATELSFHLKGRHLSVEGNRFWFVRLRETRYKVLR